MPQRPFVMGSETEFGIACLDPREQNHITNSLRLVGLCPDLPSPDCLWDYEGENPLLDVFGHTAEGEREDPDPYANRALNKPLVNGGRLYVDGAHPEYSTPEVTDPKELVRFETAGERIVDACRRTAEQGGGPRYVLYKNNSDGKGNSYGYHENYSVPRRVPVQRLVEGLMPFLVTRMIFCGAGKVGAENGRPGAPYQISQRADFFEALVELNTMVRRPLFNTRDEPHADPAAWMRLHVIPADSNMAQVSTFLKAGTMALVLRLIEDEAVGEPPRLKAPLQALSAVSRDLTLGPNVEVEGGAALTPVQVQRHYLERVKAHFAVQDLPGSFPEVVRRWEAVLDALERDPMSLERELDWVIKYRMIETYLRHKGLDWDSPRTRAMDLQYHDLDPAKGLYHTLRARGLVEELVDEPAVAEAVRGAPEDTRAWFRGQCLARFGKAVYGVSWSSVLLTTADGIRRIPTLNPLRGTRAITAPLFEGCDDPEALVARLEAGG